MKIDQTEKYINWNKSKTTRSSVVPGWDPSAIDVPWTEVIQTEEVVVGDPWDI